MQAELRALDTDLVEVESLSECEVFGDDVVAAVISTRFAEFGR